MKFSVIIPAHNEEQKIARALQSIRDQSFKDYEIIVVCDACTDHTKDIAREFGAKVIEINGHCSAAARNAGLDVAQGEWVLFCDADDWYLHEFAFQQLADKVGKRGEDVLIFSLIWRHVGYGTIRSPRGTIYPHVANKCWRRSAIGNTRFPVNVKVGEDQSFFHAMLPKIRKIEEWDMPLYYYNYLAPGSKSEALHRTVEHTIEYWRNH